MNHIYRVVWRAALGTWVAVAEIARGQSRSSSSGERPAGLRFARRALRMLPLSGVIAASWAMAQTAVVAPGSQANVYVSPNGVTVVNINGANGAGVSHNRYTQFNVDARGLVLNNTNTAQMQHQSQLAGQVMANYNMANPARVILNEVVSANRSQLAGYTEVLGGRADVVLANPYGITCNGCGFINTDRVTLSTGVPNLRADGSLAGFAVSQGDILIQGAGLNGSAQQILDLVTRSVKIDGQINAQDLGIYTGAINWDYGTRSVTGPAAAAGATPAYAIDSSALGGMYANRIRLVATEAGVGVRMLGNAAANIDDFTLNAAGRIELTGNRISAQRDVLVASTDPAAAAIALANATATAGRNASVTAANGGVSLNGGMLVAGGDLQASARSIASSGASRLQAGGALSASATGGDLSLDVAAVRADGYVQLDASGAVRTASGDGQGVQSTGGNVAITAGSGLFNEGVVSADKGSLDVRAASVDNGGKLNAGQSVSIADTAGGGAGTVTNRGDVVAGTSLATQAATVTNSGWLQAGSGNTVTAGTVDNSGRIVALGGDATLNVDQLLKNTGKIQAQQNIALRSSGGGATAQLRNSGEMRAIGAMNLAATDIVNDGALVSGSASTLDAGTLVNNADIYTDGVLTASAGQITNNANLLSGGTMVLDADGITNAKAGWVQAKDGSRVTASKTLDNAGTWLLSQAAGSSDSVQAGTQLTNSGTLQSAGNATVTAGSLANSGALAAGGALTATTTGTLSNTGSGVLQAGSKLTTDAGGAMSNASGAVMVGQGVDLRGAQGLSNQGLVYASGGDAQLRVSGTLDNSGRIQASGKLDLADRAGDSTQAVDNSGWIQADGGSTVKAASLDNTGVWLLSTQAGAAASTVSVTGTLSNGDGTNAAVLQAMTDATINAQRIDNKAQGLIRAGGALQANLSGATGLSNAGTLQAGGRLGVSGTGSLTNSAGGQLLGDELQVAMGSIANSGAIQGGSSAASSLSATGTLSNASGGVITASTSAAGGGSVSGGTITNQGTLQSLGDLSLKVGTGGLSNTGDGTTNGRIVADGDIAIQANGANTYSATIGGTLQSGGALSVTGNGASRIDVQGTAKAGSASVNIGQVNVGALGVLASNGQLDLTAGSLTLGVQGSGATAKTGRVLAALSGTGKGTINVTGNLSNNGLLFSGRDLSVTAPNIEVGTTGAISALNDLTVTANGGSLDLAAATPAANAGKIANGGLLYAGNNLTVEANGSLVNGALANGTVAAEAQINATNVNLRANTVVNNTAINAGNDISIVAATFRNEIAGGDTRYWERSDNSGTQELAHRDDGDDGGNLDEAWLYQYTYTYVQKYATALPSLVPQITAGRNLTVAFHDGKNLGATMYAGNQMTLQGFSVDAAQTDRNLYASMRINDGSHGFRLDGASFVNDNLALESQSHTVQWSETTKWKALGPASYYKHALCSTTGGGEWDAVCYADGVNDTYTSSWANPANAGLYAVSLRGSGFSLTNNGATGNSSQTVGTGGADLSSKLTGSAPSSRPTPKTQGQGAAVGAIGQAGTSAGQGPQGGSTPSYGGSTAIGGKSYLNDNAANGVNGTSFGGINITLPGNPNGYFVQSLDPNSRYLVETNPLYLQGGATVGSDYLSKLLGYNPDQLGLRLGDASYEAWLVKQQLIKQTGTAVLGSYANADTQMKDMMEHAASQSNSLGLVFGKALTPDQQANLKQDIVWMVQTQIEGKTVLTPVVYLAQSTKDKIATGAVISAQDANLSLSSLTNTGGTIIGSNSLVVASTGDISNLSGLIKGGNVSLTSTEGSIVNKTLSQESGGASYYSTQLGKTAGIESTGSLSLDAKKDITNLGANMTAGGDATLKAGNNITFDTIEKKDTNTTSGKVDGGFTTTTTSTTTQVKSGLTVGGNLNASAGNDITLAGTDAKVGGNATLDAANNVNIIARENSTQTHTETKTAGIGQNNSLYSSTTTTTDATSVRNVGSTLQVGGDAKISAGKDITFQGSSADVKGSGDLQAGNNINVLAGRNYDESTTVTKTSSVMQVSAGSGKSTESASGAEASSGRGLASASANASASASGQGSAGLAFSSTTETTTTSTDLVHVGSTLNFGKDLNVKAGQDVNLQGSTVNAGGNATVSATNVNLLAAEDVHTTSTTTTTTRVGLMASTDNKAEAGANASAGAQGGKGTPGASAQASAEASVSSENKLDLMQREESKTTTLDTKNQGSAINAGGNLSVTATDTLTLQGSGMSSGGNMDLKATDMKFLAAEDKHESTSSSSKTSAGLYADANAKAEAKAGAEAGLGAQAGASAGGSAGVEVGLYGTNTTSHSVEGSTTAVTSSLKSGGDINRTAANNITDVGTQIEGAGNLNQSAQTIDSFAARNTTYSSSDSTTHTAKIGAYAEASAGASAQAQVGPNANKPGTESSAGAGIRASYEYENSTSASSSSTAVTSGIKMGGSVNSTSSGKTTMEGTQIQAGKDVNLAASSLDYQAAKNTSSSSSKDTSANATVSVDLVKKEVGVGVGYEGNKSSESSSTAVVGGIVAGGNLSVKTSGDTRFEGTQIAAGGAATVDAGGSVKFDAAKNTATSSKEGLAVSVEVSGGKSGGSGEAGVGYSKSNASLDQDVAGSITSGSGPLTIKSGGDASFTGTQIGSTSGNVTVAAGGNIDMKAARTVEHSDSLGVDVSASASGGKDSKGGTKNATTGKKTGETEVDQRAGAASVGVGVSKSDSNTASVGSISSGGGSITLSSGGNTKLEGTQVNAAQGIGVSTGGSFETKAAVSTHSSSTVGVSASASGSTQTPTKKGTTGSGGTGTTNSGTTNTGTTNTGTGSSKTGTGTGTGVTTQPRNPLEKKGGSGVASVYVDNQSGGSSQGVTLNGGGGQVVVQQGVKPGAAAAQPAAPATKEAAKPAPEAKADKGAPQPAAPTKEQPKPAPAQEGLKAQQAEAAEKRNQDPETKKSAAEQAKKTAEESKKTAADKAKKLAEEKKAAAEKTQKAAEEQAKKAAAEQAAKKAAAEQAVKTVSDATQAAKGTGK